MSAPQTPAFRISSAAAASPPNPPPTICACIGLLPGLDGGKAARRAAFAPVVAYESEADVAGRFRDVLYILDKRYSRRRAQAANNRPVRMCGRRTRRATLSGHVVQAAQAPASWPSLELRIPRRVGVPLV